MSKIQNNSKNFTLCLNMIVKNEGKIILETLANLCSKMVFDYWVICDTGSTDNTKEIIQTFFEEMNIKGELFEDKWVDFGHNRTLALERSFGKTDYLYINDADDHIEGDIIFPENIFEFDSYSMKLVLHTIHYQRVQLINNRKKFVYKGVLHEYIECLEENKSSYLNGNYFINAGTFGSRSDCTEKYLKDANILEKAYEKAILDKDELHKRYSFYCANSYFDANNSEKAIFWYKNTLSLDNWYQEKYISCLKIFTSYQKLNRVEEGIYYLIESFNYDKKRVEGILKLIQHYTIKNKNEIAFSFYVLVQNYYENEYLLDSFSFNNKLFISVNDYSFFLPYYMIIVCERLKKYDIGLKMYTIIFAKKNIDIDIFWLENLIHNLYFFIDKNKDSVFISKWKNYLSLVENKYPTIVSNLMKKFSFLHHVFNF
jgi:hypothetical protein